MRILIVSAVFPPSIGGIERHSTGLGSYLSSIDHEVCILRSEFKHRSQDDGNTPNFDQTGIDSKLLLGRLPVPTIKGIIQILRYGRKLKEFDLIFMQSHLFVLTWFISLLNCSRVPAIWINHGSDYVPTSPMISKVLKVYEDIGLNVLRRQSSFFYAVSKQACNWASLKTGKEFVMLPNAIESASFKNIELKDFSSTTLTCLFVGRIIPEKGCLDAIQIIEDVNSRLTDLGIKRNLRIKIIGLGNDLKRIQFETKAFQTGIEFLGALDHISVLHEMKNSDIFVFPSRYPEGLPTVILEACASKMLVFCSDLPGIEEIKESGGIVVGDKYELTRALFDLVTDPSEALEISKMGNHLVIEKYSWESILINSQLANYLSIVR